MKSNVLRRWHFMIGCDWHIAYPPPAATPVGRMPYFVVNIMTNVLHIEFTVLYAKTVEADTLQNNMCRTTDIGMLTPHIGPPSVLLPIELFLSASKSHFGPMSVQCTDQHGGDQCLASALLCVVNPNLNCGTPIPTPLGFVIAFNTTQCELSLADILTGLFSMAMDFVLQWLMGKLPVGKAFDWLGKKVAPRLGIKLLNRAAARAAGREAWKAAGKQGPLKPFADAAMKNAKDRLSRFLLRFENIGSNIAGFFIGSPLGTDFGAPGIGGTTPFGLAQKGLGALGISDQGVYDKMTAPPTAPAPPPASPPPATTTPASPGPAPTPTPTTGPQGAVNNYLTDPSVEHIGGP
ncbi:hypothetical protein LVJ94_46120 [Pendulispora rubella]|uniref:Uncharacterized protein n=1 Tax=Pendulispora rubella TaxID=2741070 RepID=A0ABZ2L006_9BACT